MIDKDRYFKLDGLKKGVKVSYFPDDKDIHISESLGALASVTYTLDTSDLHRMFLVIELEGENVGIAYSGESSELAFGRIGNIKEVQSELINKSKEYIKEAKSRNEKYFLSKMF